jgi:hypothetical protein
VEETVYVIDEDDEEENVRTVKKQSEMLFVRGEIACGILYQDLWRLMNVQETQWSSYHRSNNEDLPNARSGCAVLDARHIMH